MSERRTHGGGCLCGSIRYETIGEPVRLTVCHCRFCQRATGSAYMVEPIFPVGDLHVVSGTPTLYSVPSAGSSKEVHIHFCATCGTKLYLTFERFPATCGIYAGTFDDPNWFDIEPADTKHIFTAVARHDSILPPGIAAYEAHAMTNDGAPLTPVTHDAPRVVGRRETTVGKA